MKTSDERREVAERLRELSSYADADGCCTVWDVLFALGLKQCDTIGFVLADDARRLADLIDPTCRKVIPNEIEGYVFCSKCGAEIGEYSVPNYCPNCGARVVSADVF